MKAKSEVFNMDCIEGMKQYPDNYFELALIDLPYGIGASKPSKKPDTVRQKNGTMLKVNGTHYQPKEWDFTLMQDDYFDELFRVSINQIIFGANYYKQLAGGMIVWDKLNGLSDQYGCEIAYQSFDKRTDIVYYMWQGMFQGVYCGKEVKKALIQQGDKSLNESRIHPTQKPVALCEWGISNYTDKNASVLDLFLGSGSTLVACEKTNRKCFGMEMSPDYCDVIVKRWQDFTGKIAVHAETGKPFAEVQNDSKT